MIFAGVDVACSPLAARLDISVPWSVLAIPLTVDTPFIRPECLLRYCHAGYQVDACRVSRSQKSEPGCPGSRAARPVGGRPGCAWYYDAGIRTVSITWITPFDWLTFAIVTVEEPPLASTIITLSPDLFTVSSSPSTSLTFLPSVRLEASSLPGTT